MEAHTVAALSGVYASKNILTLDVWRAVHQLGRDLVSSVQAKFLRRTICRNTLNDVLRSVIDVYLKFAPHWTTLDLVDNTTAGGQEPPQSLLFCICVRPDQSVDQHHTAICKCDGLDVLWSFMDHLCSAIATVEEKSYAHASAAKQEEEEDSITWSLHLQVQSLQKDVTEAHRTWSHVLCKLHSPCNLRTSDGASPYVEFLAMRDSLLQRWIEIHMRNALAELASLQGGKAASVCIAHMLEQLHMVYDRADLVAYIQLAFLICLTVFYKTDQSSPINATERPLDLEVQECIGWGAHSVEHVILEPDDDSSENSLRVDWRRTRWLFKRRDTAQQLNVLHAEAAALHYLICTAPSSHRHARTYAEMATRINQRRSELEGILALCIVHLRTPSTGIDIACKTYECLEHIRRNK